MVPTILNTFATGQTPGTAVSAASSGNGSAGTPFDAVSVGAGNTLTIAPGGGANVTVGVSAGQPAYVEWTTALVPSGTSATLYASIGLDFASAPATGLAILRGMSGSAQRWRVELTSGRLIQVRNKDNNTVGSPSAALATNTHHRIEVAAAGHDSAGAIEVRIFAGNGTSPVETLGPFTAQVLGGPVASIRYIVGASASPGTATTMHIRYVGASTTAWLGPAVPTPTVGHVWVGAVTHDSTLVSYGTSHIGSARLVVSTSEALSSPVYSSAVSPDSDGFVKLTRGSLAVDTPYYFGIEADGVLLEAGRGSFRTDPTPGSPASFSVAFGSCQQTNSNAETFSKIANRVGPYGKARRMLHEGDLHYRDFGAGTTAADVVAQYKTSLSTANMMQLLSTVPTAYVWDNHDWGGTDSNAAAPAGPVLAAAYRQVVPHYPLATAGAVAIHQSWAIGRVRFIALDTRSQRSDRTLTESSSKTMLGSEQKAWFRAQLQQPEPLKIVMSGIYWRRDAVNGDRWGSYQTEWAEIRDWVAAQGAAIGKVLVVSGDRHALYADDGTGGTGGGTYWPNVGGAAFDQGSSQPYETWTHGYYYGVHQANLRAYGWLDIEDSGASITVAYSGITSADDVVRVSMTVEVPAAAALPARWGIHLR
ncbi:alkaline phosphatase D family protein [Verrucosispora sp. NA02020]|uniref:alkaline phosphatase D family protein n=1 Tax=Verrucosispora sp. NA02020 TaxID=2742132 RepID=UPI001591BA6E|nr:alkaline phosphatase D family protein [Verrucosispora sp. NA02020]QKW15389.1 alkaline phosphatase D family protein [Verrucosispora sp. NA02020]